MLFIFLPTIFPGAAGLSWTWTRDLAREVNPRTCDTIQSTNWKRINRFFFRSDSSFPNAAYNFLSVVLRSPSVLVPLFFLFPHRANGEQMEITFDEKRRRWKTLLAQPRDTPRSFFEPALLPCEEMDKDIPSVALIQGLFVVGGRRPRSYFYLHQAFFYSYD